MLKHVLLAGSMLIAAPAFAQTAPATTNTPAAPQTTPAMPATPAPMTPPAADPAAPPVDAAPPATTAATPPAAPVADPMAPAPNAQAATPAPADPATAAAAPAPAAPAGATAPAGAQVADIVGKEFPVYDKNGNGTLSKAEFGTWMLALKKTADPAAKDDAANKAWTTGAFATADTDKSKSISKDELTNFLAQGQTKAS
ncbi:MAG: EF-hand domain-containing protein [Pseudomonadota bacterium]